MHMEVVTDLRTEALIASWERFIAHRSRPGKLYSDNGTNFMGANRELTELLRQSNQEKITDVLTTKGIS